MEKSVKDTSTVSLDQVRSYWNASPVAASAVPYPLGTPEYFTYYDRLRERNESVEFSYALHEYKRFGGKKVLDVGCGNGYVLSRFANEGAETYGVDLTPAAVELCRKRFAFMGLEGDFRVGNAEALPFDDNTFDCVTSMGVLHHTPDTPRSVHEVFRVLKPGGRVILMFYHRNSVLYRWRFPIVAALTGKSIQQLVNEVDGSGNPKGDVYTKREAAQLLREFTGLEMFAGLLEGSMFVPRIGRIIPKVLFRPFERRAGWFLYIKGYKPHAAGWNGSETQDDRP